MSYNPLFPELPRAGGRGFPIPGLACLPRPSEAREGPPKPQVQAGILYLTIPLNPNTRFLTAVRQVSLRSK